MFSLLGGKRGNERFLYTVQNHKSPLITSLQSNLGIWHGQENGGTTDDCEKTS
jgi:hypothetical protein